MGQKVKMQQTALNMQDLTQDTLQKEVTMEEELTLLKIHVKVMTILEHPTERCLSLM